MPGKLALKGANEELTPIAAERSEAGVKRRLSSA